jgi:methylenetetrahydrofolate dehydrogenase (NADP+) / methenyltetrahydrofolate cyclohydrolase
MLATVIDGRRYADDLTAHLREELAALRSRGGQPGLGTVLVGSDEPAATYERRLRRLAEELACHYVCETLPDDVEEAEAVAMVGKLDADPRISGILILRPLPTTVSGTALYRALDPLKDIEAVHPMNAGLLALGRPRYVPSAPAACFHTLDCYLVESGRDPAAFYERSTIVIVGRSPTVGRPAILLGLARNATIVSCDIHTFRAGRLFEHTRTADVLIVAAGVPGLIRGDHVREGVIAIDVGTTAITDAAGRTRLVGDLEADSVAERAEAITPVPGGIGPVTDVWLLRSAVAAGGLALDLEAAHPTREGYGLPEAIAPRRHSL